jgi:N-acetylmuramoyl-L-alanine amidase
MRVTAMFIMLFFTGFKGPKQAFKIIQKPIIYNQARINLSIQYLQQRHGITQTTATIVPKIIVLHYTAGGTLQSNFNYFNKVEIEGARTINKKQSTLNVSAHFLVDRDGTVYQLMPETYFARHTIGLNYCAIGVENVGSKTQPLTNAQAAANISLIQYLQGKYAIEHVIGHNEYLQFKNTKWFKETNPAYVTYKEDPGVGFMKKVRAGLQ